MSDDDDTDMDEWMAMSEAEQERELQAAMNQYDEWYSRLSFAERVALSRHRTVALCLKWRRLIREHDMDFLRDQLRQSQVRLLKIREWRRTGSYPATA